MPHIPACKGDHRCFGLRHALLRYHWWYGLWQGLGSFRFYRLRQGPGRCVFKLGSSFARIEKMPHRFLVDHSVFFIPREDKALPSIHILLTELRSHLPSRPARDNRPRFFVFISVITVSTYHDQHVIILSKNRMKMKNRHPTKSIAETLSISIGTLAQNTLFREISILRLLPEVFCDCRTNKSFQETSPFFREALPRVSHDFVRFKSKVLQGCLHLYIPYPSTVFSIRHIFH